MIADTREKINNVLSLSGVWRAVLIEDRETASIILSVPKTSVNIDIADYHLRRLLPCSVNLIVHKSNGNFLKNRKKYTYEWGTLNG